MEKSEIGEVFLLNVRDVVVDPLADVHVQVYLLHIVRNMLY